MSEISSDHSKVFLFPPCINDWLPDGHPARFIDLFVESIDLKEAGFKPRKSEVGRPNYSNSLLLKVWLYGLYEKLYSSRMLERACNNQVPLMWLTGMNPPDHNTLWRFFRDNRDFLKRVFKQSVQIAYEGGLVGLALQAVDGTKIYADVSQDRSLHKKDLTELGELIEKGITEVIGEIKKREKAERGQPGYKLPEELQDKRKLTELIRKGIDKLSLEKRMELKEGIDQALEELDQSESEHLNLTDRESVMMKNDRKIQFSYNAQCIVDEQEQVIVGAEVSVAPNDRQLLIEMIEESEESTGHRCEETLGDGGYFSGEELKMAREKGYPVLLPLPPEISGKGKIKGRDERFLKGKFEYDETRDIYRCPEGKELIFSEERTRLHPNNSRMPVRSYRCLEYKSCKHRGACCIGKGARRVERTAYDTDIEALKTRLSEKSNREKLKSRSRIVEPVFGWIKWCHGFRRWKYRGLKSVRAQWMLMCTVINLKKLIKNWQAGVFKWEMSI